MPRRARTLYPLREDEIEEIVGEQDTLYDEDLHSLVGPSAARARREMQGRDHILDDPEDF